MSLACQDPKRRQKQFKLAPSLLKRGRQLQAHTQLLKALIHVYARSIGRNLQEKTAGRTKIDGSVIDPVLGLSRNNPVPIMECLNQGVLVGSVTRANCNMMNASCSKLTPCEAPCFVKRDGAARSTMGCEPNEFAVTAYFGKAYDLPKQLAQRISLAHFQHKIVKSLESIGRRNFR